jgi:hypothetical protein
LFANEGSFVFKIGPDDVAVATLTFPGFLSHQKQSREALFVERNGDQPCVS